MTVQPSRGHSSPEPPDESRPQPPGHEDGNTVTRQDASAAPQAKAPAVAVDSDPSPAAAPSDTATRATTSATKRGHPPLVIGAALVTVVLWASAFVGIRAAGRALSPGPLTLGRLFIGTVVLGAFVAARRSPLPPRGDIPRVLVCGILWFAIYNVALNASEQRIDAGTASLIISIGPLLVTGLAAVLLREGLPRSLVLGGAIAFCGAILIGTATTGHSSSASVGSLLCLIATVTYAGAVIAQKPLLARSSALVITWLSCLVGMVCTLPFAPELIHQLGDAPTSSIVWTVYLGALPTALAFTTWAYALARTTAGRMAAMSYLVPPLAVLMGWLLLGETPAWLALGGGALCLGGVAFSQAKKWDPGRRNGPDR